MIPGARQEVPTYTRRQKFTRQKFPGAPLATLSSTIEHKVRNFFALFLFFFIVFNYQCSYSLNMEMITVRHEHRLIEETNLGKWYGKDFILPAGYIIRKSKGGNKLRFYSLTWAHGVAFDVPVEKVGVFKITRTVTETEKMI